MVCINVGITECRPEIWGQHLDLSWKWHPSNSLTKFKVDLCWLWIRYDSMEWLVETDWKWWYNYIAKVVSFSYGSFISVRKKNTVSTLRLLFVAGHISKHIAVTKPKINSTSKQINTNQYHIINQSNSNSIRW